jgi:DNA-directed RNA polymerase specialized sigma24 family protein
MNGCPTRSAEADDGAVERAHARHRDGATFLYGKYIRAVKVTLRRYTQDESAIEDLSQETFASAFRNLACLRDVARLRAWLTSRARASSRRTPARPARGPFRWRHSRMIRT